MNDYIGLITIITFFATVFITQGIKHYGKRRHVIEELKRGGAVSEVTLMRMYGLSHLQIYRILIALRKRGLVERLEDQPTWLYRWRWAHPTRKPNDHEDLYRRTKNPEGKRERMKPRKKDDE